MANNIFSNVCSEFESGGKTYRVYFNLNVMQRLQLEFGSLTNCFNNLLATPHNLFVVLHHMLNEGAKVSKAEILKMVSNDVVKILGLISEIVTFSISGPKKQIKKCGKRWEEPFNFNTSADKEEWDFTWIYYVGVAKLKLPFQCVGKLTYFEFTKLYEHYKNDFDMELMLKASNTTYGKLAKKNR